MNGAFCNFGVILDRARRPDQGRHILDFCHAWLAGYFSRREERLTYTDKFFVAGREGVGDMCSFESKAFWDMRILFLPSLIDYR